MRGSSTAHPAICLETTGLAALASCAPLKAPMTTPPLGLKNPPTSSLEPPTPRRSRTSGHPGIPITLLPLGDHECRTSCSRCLRLVRLAARLADCDIHSPASERTVACSDLVQHRILDLAILYSASLRRHNLCRRLKAGFNEPAPNQLRDGPVLGRAQAADCA